MTSRRSEDQVEGARSPGVCRTEASSSVSESEFPRQTREKARVLVKPSVAESLTVPAFPVRELLFSSVGVGSVENQGGLTMYTSVEKPTRHEELQLPSQADLMTTNYGTVPPTAWH